MVLESLTEETDILEQCSSLEILDFKQFLLLEHVVGLKKYFQWFLIWAAVVVLKELIFKSVYLGRVW